MAETPIGARISGVEHRVEDIKRAVEGIGNHRNGTQNVTQVTFSGLGSASAILAVGLAAGVALGTAGACAAWVSWALSDVKETQRDQQAFIQATYQQAPQLRAEFDRIKAENAQN